MSQKSRNLKIEPENERGDKVKQLIQSMRILKEIFTIIMALAFTNAIIHFFVNPSVCGTYEGKHLSDFGCVGCWILFLIITTIMRFYHGNSIHLKHICRADLLLENRIRSPPCMEALFLISESIIFALMSIYQFNVEYLFWLFVILFSIDFILFSKPRRVIYNKLIWFIKYSSKLIRERVRKPLKVKKLIWFIKYNSKLIRERVRKPLKVKKLMELRRYSVKSILKQVLKSLDAWIYSYSAETKWTIVNTLTVLILLGFWIYRGGSLFVDHITPLGLWNYMGSLFVDHTILCGLLNYRGGSLFVDHTCEFLTIITLNLVLDYGLNWKFYFPPIHGT